VQGTAAYREPSCRRGAGTTAAYGASPSLPDAPAKVRSQPDVPTLVIVYCQRMVFEFTSYALASRQWQAGWRRGSRRWPQFSKVPVILGEPLVLSEPGEGALDHPVARKDDEVLSVVAPLDDLHASGGTFATAASTCRVL